MLFNSNFLTKANRGFTESKTNIRKAIFLIFTYRGMRFHQYNEGDLRFQF